MLFFVSCCLVGVCRCRVWIGLPALACCGVVLVPSVGLAFFVCWDVG